MERRRHHALQDEHHLANYKQEWELRPESLYVRRHMGMIALMWREGHEDLHRNTAPVPVPAYYTLQRAVRLWEPVKGDVVASVDSLSVAIDKAASHPKTKPIERELAQLTIQGFQDQLPFIREWGIERG